MIKITEEKISLSQLKKIKGIGEKTINRIRDNIVSYDINNAYDARIKLEKNKIYHGDCLELMNGIPDNSLNLIVTDPPYLIDYQSNRRTKQEQFDKIKNDKNNITLIKNAVAQFNRILKKDSALYMFCSWHNIDFFKQELELYFNIKNVIVWNKNNHGSGDLKGSYAPKHEFIIFAHKGRSLLREHRYPDVLNFDKVPSVKLKHPTEKPIDLLQLLIKNSSDKNDTVLDPFCGAGSTLVAAAKLNRKWIGIDCSEKYCEISRKRINNLKK